MVIRAKAAEVKKKAASKHKGYGDLRGRGIARGSLHAVRLEESGRAARENLCSAFFSRFTAHCVFYIILYSMFGSTRVLTILKIRSLKSKH